MKNDPTVIVPVAMPDSLHRAVKAKSERRHGKRGLSRHCREVLTLDLKKK